MLVKDEIMFVNATMPQSANRRNVEYQLGAREEAEDIEHDVFG